MTNFSPQGNHWYVRGYGNGHNGVDYGWYNADPDGSRHIHAFGDGVVSLVQDGGGYNQGWGNRVFIDHGNGWESSYNHLRTGGIRVGKGQTVKQGEWIAYMGTTGDSSGDHLHVELWKNGARVNPESYYGQELPGTAPAQDPITSNNQRRVGPSGVVERSIPVINDSTLTGREFDPGEVLTFKGYVDNGDEAFGSRVWFIGAFSGTAFHSSRFEDTGTHDLPKLNADPQPSNPYVRKINADGGVANVRALPLTTAAVVTTKADGAEVNVAAGVATDGTNVSGSTDWFKIAEGWVHSSTLTNADKAGIPNLTGTWQGTTPTPDNPEEPYTFKPDLACVTKVVPAHKNNFEVGNFPAKPEKVVIHDFGTDGKDTFESTINWFKSPNAEVSAQFVVGTNKATGKVEIIQMVKLGDRAYHAGKNGNGFIGIETEPSQSPAVIAATKQLLKELRDKYGYKFALIEHNQILSTSCGDDVDLANYEIDPPVVTDPDLPDGPGEGEPDVPDGDETPGWFKRFLEGLMAFFKSFLGGK